MIVQGVPPRILFANTPCAEISGYTRGELLALPPEEALSLVYAPDREALLVRLSDHLAGRQVQLTGEFRMVRKDGDIRWLEYFASRIEHGGQPAIQAAFIDVTARREVEEQLRLQTTALEAAANAIVIADREGTILWANPAFEQLTGYALDEVLGQNPRFLKSGVHDPPFYEGMWQTILAGQVWHEEVVNRRKDGVLYTEEMTITPVRDSQGEIGHFIAIKQDVTDRKRAEQELLSAKEAAEAANRAKSTFLANMSHELRTPLNAIIGYSEILEEEAEDLELAGFVPDLQRIQAAGQRLLMLVRDVLDLANIESGRMELKLSVFDVDALVKDVVQVVAPLAEQQGNTLAVRCTGPLGAMVADAAKVRQVLLNLLSNASKFTEDGQISLTVNRLVQSGREWLVFGVSDTGIGIAPEQAESLFEAFTLGDASATRRHGGTGLGLAISQRFCVMMGGEITVESQVGEGSTFTVRIPAQVDDRDSPGAST
jgi:PAS domain S-box-containing protein